MLSQLLVTRQLTDLGVIERRGRTEYVKSFSVADFDIEVVGSMTRDRVNGLYSNA
jgi:hypothetical protein